MKLNITDKHFLELIKQGFDLNCVFLLKLIHEGNEIDSLCAAHEKISLMRQSLIRKHLISEDGHLFPEGQELITFIDSKISGKISKKVPLEDNGFNEWWATFPGVNQFTYKNRTFAGDRALRIKKDDCRLKFEKILSEGEYTSEELINALKLEIESKKESSIKTGTNKLTYMHDSLTYLNQRDYEPFIELLKTQQEIEQINTIGGVDI